MDDAAFYSLNRDYLLADRYYAEDAHRTRLRADINNNILPALETGVTLPSPPTLGDPCSLPVVTQIQSCIASKSLYPFLQAHCASYTAAGDAAKLVSTWDVYTTIRG
jgi:hypothetical protein